MHHSVCTFHLFNGLDLSSLQEEHSIELRQQYVKILEDPFSDCLDLIGVIIADEDVGEPKRVAAADRKSL